MTQRAKRAPGGAVTFHDKSVTFSPDGVGMSDKMRFSQPGFADGGSPDDILDAPKRMSERAMRRATNKGRAGLELAPEEVADLASHGRWTEQVGEPMARGAIANASGIPQFVQAGQDMYADPSLGNATNLGARAALLAFKPAMAAKVLAGGLGLGAASDLGLSPFHPAEAAGSGVDDGLSDAERSKLVALEKKIANRAFRNNAEKADATKEVERLRSIQSDYRRDMNRSRIRASEGVGDQKLQEFDRSVKTAERARDKELGRQRRFSDTEVGKVWDKTAGLMPMVFGAGLGGLSRAASGGGSGLKDYGLPAIFGGIAGAASSNIPLAYNAFFTEPDNPERRAYEAYARELPPDHPRKQEWSTYAAGLPEANPVRKAASDELYDPIKALERMGFGGLEGAGGGLAGADMVRMPGRLIEHRAEMPGRARAAGARSNAIADAAEADGALAQQGRLQAQLSADELRQLVDESRGGVSGARPQSGTGSSGTALVPAPTSGQPPVPGSPGNLPALPSSPPPTWPGTEVPLPPGVAINSRGIPYDVHTGQTIKKRHYTAKPDNGKATGGAVDMALKTAAGYARGGRVHVGPVIGNTGGREDAKPVSVPAGAYVIPADCVASMPEAGNNTLAGMKKLEGMFGKSQPRRADGGAIPIKISDGEFVVAPEKVAQIGGGDMNRGHKILDAFVRKVRDQHIKTLQSLPPPAKD